jgi:hypothetical protein
VPGGRIKIACGFVRQQQRRIICQRAGDGHALLLPPDSCEELVMAAPGEPVGQQRVARARAPAPVNSIGTTRSPAPSTTE